MYKFAKNEVKITECDDIRTYSAIYKEHKNVLYLLVDIICTMLHQASRLNGHFQNAKHFAVAN